MWTSILLLALGAPPDSLESPAPEVVPQPSSAFVDSVRGCLVEAKSANFRVINRANHLNAREVARLCEVWRSHLRTTLSGKPDDAAWTQKCEVVVHGKKSDYLAASIKDKKGLLPRINLVAERDGSLAALPREITQIVLADLFGGKTPPRWASTGLAILADSEEKQKLHQQELQAAFDKQLDFRVVEILRMENVPPANRVAAFHGQSASLASFLVHRDKPEKFAKFIALAIDHGYDQALRDIYAIDGVAELERLWTADRQAALAFHGLRLALDEANLHPLVAK